MARIERLEGALLHITDLLVLQGERMDFGFTSLREEMRGMREEMQGVREETRGMREETRSMREETRSMRDEARGMRESVSDRLDRLIAITTKERTTGIERLASIEMRLARLEERVGI
jgi:uncharacterized coiled-coil DUF342 family protein